MNPDALSLDSCTSKDSDGQQTCTSSSSRRWPSKLLHRPEGLKQRPQKPVVEEFYFDKSPTKPQRKFSPPRTREGRNGTVAPNINRIRQDKLAERFEMHASVEKERRLLREGRTNKGSVASVSPTGCLPVFPSDETLPNRQNGPRRRSSPSYQRHISHPSNCVMMIQVAPGVKAPLRGSEETWLAIQDDFYMPGLCLGCSTTLFVIQDAAFCLCPDCRTISPMEGDFVDRIVAGVGLGLKYDDLTKWQAEVVHSNNFRREK